MAKKAVLTGQFTLLDESSGRKEFEFDLGSHFSAVTGITNYSSQELALSSGTTKSINEGKEIQNLFLSCDGPITIKHGSNPNGISVEQGIILFGKLSQVLLQTSSTSAVTVKYYTGV